MNTNLGALIIKRIILISYRTILWSISTFVFLGCIIGYWYLSNRSKSEWVEVINTNDKSIMDQLKLENEKLQGILSSILPIEQKVIYENPYRLYHGKTFTETTVPLLELMDKGKEIHFKQLHYIDQYKRPMYDSGWRSFYFRRWLYLPYKIANAHHRMFIFPFGASSNFSFAGQQGIRNFSVDFHRNINLLIYNFHVEDIKLYNNQVALIGEPKREGMQVVSIIQDDLLNQGVNTKDLLFQLTTPKGYEIDYIVGKVTNYDYMMEQIEKNTVRQTFINISVDKTLEELEQENIDLKKDLSYYIPMDQDTFITSQNCRPPMDNIISKSVDISTAKEQGTPIQYQTIYQKPDFKRPLYDPIWKEYIHQGKTLVPDKICENIHNLFIIPTNPEEQKSFLQNLSIHDKISMDSSKGSSYILLFNFQPQQVIQHEQQIIILGTPTRKGAYIISLGGEIISSYKEYLIQLVTPDLMEIDYNVLSVK